MTNSVIFYNETASNGRFTVKSQVELPLRWYGKNGIHTHQNKIYKNLITYHPTKKELENLKNEFTLTRTSF